MNAERAPDRTTAARSRGRQPAASRHSPRSSEPRRRSAAATACWTGRRSPSRFTFTIPSRVPRVRFLFRADEAVFEVPSITPPFVEPAPPEPSNGCRRCDLLAAIDLPRGAHPVPRRFTNPRPQIGRRRNPSAKPSSVQRSCRSAADARGSEATDASVRLQRLVGRLHRLPTAGSLTSLKRGRRRFP